MSNRYSRRISLRPQVFREQGLNDGTAELMIVRQRAFPDYHDAEDLFVTKEILSGDNTSVLAQELGLSEWELVDWFRKAPWKKVFQVLKKWGHIKKHEGYKGFRLMVTVVDRQKKKLKWTFQFCAMKSSAPVFNIENAPNLISLEEVQKKAQTSRQPVFSEGVQNQYATA